MNAPALTKETVLAIHAAAIAKFGGLGGVCDEGLLESALAQPFQSFGGQDLYPSAIDKACRYAFGIIGDHPFVDGNKRTATAVMGACLRMSDIDFRPSHDALLKTMLGIAEGTLGYDDLVLWVQNEIA